jgi:O-antigen biosynthesis protein
VTGAGGWEPYIQIEMSELVGKFFDAVIHLPGEVGRLLRRPFIPLAFHKSGRSRGWLRRLRSEEQAPTLFDSSYYLERYFDVANAGIDPYSHFVHNGWREGRNPNEYFDVSWYLERNPDVEEAGIGPLRHYIECGWKEGRDPGPKFSVKDYLDRYRDVQDAGVEPLDHYIRYGKLEGRLISESQLTDGSYGDWIAKYDALDDKIRSLMFKRLARLALQPKLSIVMPVYNTDLRWLREAIESVRAQLYRHWELCISDDASTLPGVKELLHEYAYKDERIRIVFRETNGHISANSNSALSVATGDFVVLMDGDDLIPEDALYWVVEEINTHPNVDLIFSDEDKIDVEGHRYYPYFKPDWNPALMLSQNVFSHLGVYRHSLVKKVGGFRLGFEGSQDHDLVWRCADATQPSKIRHIPHILYHWRATPESTASSSEVKPYAWNAGAQAIEDHLARNGVKGRVTRALTMFYQVNYDPPAEWPKVSVVIPSGCKLELLRPCLGELLARTTYPNFEVLLTVNEIRFQNEEQAACLKEFAKDPRVRVLVYKDRDFSYSWVNNWAAKQAIGSILCLMNDDIKIITTDWLEKLTVRLQLNRVGAVGVMLYYPNETIQHAGVILGMGGVAGHAFKGAARGSDGYCGRAGLEQDLCCVTAACVAIRREVFEDLNGFDERLAIAFNDVDFCIRLREKGWRIIWTPEVEHYHLESQTIGRHNSDERGPLFEKEVRMMRDQWRAVLDSDPFYNPNLSLRNDKMALAFPPRAAKSVVSD